jgi:CRP/FNR family cyclic AMP-dependent transcriptional regulator
MGGDIRPTTSGSFDKRFALQRHPLLGRLGEEAIEKLAERAISKSFRHGSTIFLKGDIGASLYIVCSGTVKISVPSTSGRNAIFNIINTGELFGEIAMLDGGSRTADAYAMTDCELLMIDRREFLPLVKNNPEIAIKLIEVLCARLRRTSEQVEDTMFLELPARLAKMLLNSLDRAIPAQGGRRIELTQLEIGQTIGMSRESTNKQLRNWELRRWIRLGRGAVVVVDVDALTDIAEGDFSEI